jgi:uncharacterized UPF0160 family protein
MGLKTDIGQAFNLLKSDGLRELAGKYYEPEDPSMGNMELADAVVWEAGGTTKEKQAELEELWSFVMENAEAVAEVIKDAAGKLGDFEERLKTRLQAAIDDDDKAEVRSQVDAEPFANGAGDYITTELENRNLLPKEQEQAMGTIATHNGEFHLDEIFAIAALKEELARQGTEPEILRTRDQEAISKALAAVDVGGAYDPKTLRFDHHQDRGATKASSGLVAEFLKGKEGWAVLANLDQVVQDIDNTDLGKPGNPALSAAISAFNPAWNEKRDEGDKSFHEALGIISEALQKSREALAQGKNPEEAFRTGVLENPVVKGRMETVENAKKGGQKTFLEAVRAAVGKDRGTTRVKIENPALPYQEMFTEAHLNANPETKDLLERINYIEFPTSTGAFGAVATPTPQDPMSQKSPFPESWRGKRGQELIETINKTSETKVEIPPGKNPNDYFCHPAGFFLAGGDEQFMEVAIERARELDAEKQNPHPQPKGVTREQAEKIKACERVGALTGPAQVGEKTKALAGIIAQREDPIPAALEELKAAQTLLTATTSPTAADLLKAEELCRTAKLRIEEAGKAIA